jgi:large subunit ribosomal protein L21
MSVVVQSGSKQYILENGQEFIVDRLPVEEGSVVELDVLFGFGVDKGVTKVEATVVKHQRGEKIRVVKFKSKSNYHRQYGYRSEQTVLALVDSKAAAKPAKKTTKAKADKEEEKSE